MITTITVTVTVVTVTVTVVVIIIRQPLPIFSAPRDCLTDGGLARSLARRRAMTKPIIFPVKQ